MRNANKAIAVVVLVLAVLIRAPGLGKWCLAEDEYYSSQPVAFILENGVPQLPGGGYYTRGIVLQYMTVGPALVFKEWEFAVRFLPLLFGVITVPLFFLLATRFMGTFPAVFCSAMLLFSSWHIEFSRFARFYAPFQFLFLLFVYSLHAGYGERKAGFRILAFCLALLSVFLDAYSIFLPILLFSLVALIDGPDRKTILSITVQAGILIAANYLYSTSGIDRIGVVNPLPPATTSANASPSLWSFLLFPDLGLLRSIRGSTIAGLAYVVLVGAAVALLWKTFRRCEDHWESIILILSLSLPLLHQYGLLAILCTVLVINKRPVWRIFRENMLFWAIYMVGTTAYWVAIAEFSGNLDKVRHYLAGFPPIKYAILIPFARSVPLMGAFLLAVLSISTLHHVMRKRSWDQRFLISVVLLLVLTMPLFKTGQHKTRYVFIFFPLVFLLAYLEAASLASWMERRWPLRVKQYAGAIILLVPVSLYAATEDFHLRHILNVSSAESNFRMGEFDRYFDHWYQRVDFETPSRYVNSASSDGDVVVADHIVMTRYLDKPFMFYVYNKLHTFSYYSRKGGTVEKWTGRPLISRPEQLAELVPADPDRSLWLIASVAANYTGSSFLFKDHNVKTIAEQYGLNAELVFLGLDERIGVWKITRRDRVP